MRRMRFVLAGLLLVGMVGIVQAQGFGGFGGGPTFLVGNKAVQEDLKLSEDQITKLKDWAKDFRDKANEIRKEEGVEFGKGGFGKIDDEMRAKLDKANAKITKEAYKQLGDILKKEQIERLKQIDRQQAGVRAFSAEDVVAALKLTDSQKSTIKGINGDLQKETREVFNDVKKGNFEGFQEAQKKVQKLQKEAQTKIEDLLDADQKKTWKSLTGEAFDLTKLQFNFPKKDTKKD